MEVVTRIFLVRPPSAGHDGAIDSKFEGSALPSMCSLLDRLARRELAAIIAFSNENSLRLLRALASRTNQPMRIEPGPEPSPSESLNGFESRVLKALDQIAFEFPQDEVVVVLNIEGIRVALARALCLPEGSGFSPEPGQAIALDWAHPDAREFQHALIGMGIDWDVGPAATKVHRFPGGASVRPRKS